MDKLLLSKKETADFIGVSLNTLLRMTQFDDSFPKPYRLTPKLTVFKLNEIVNWVDSLNHDGFSTKTRNKSELATSSDKTQLTQNSKDGDTHNVNNIIEKNREGIIKLYSSPNVEA